MSADRFVAKRFAYHQSDIRRHFSGTTVKPAKKSVLVGTKIKRLRQRVGIRLTRFVTKLGVHFQFVKYACGDALSLSRGAGRQSTPLGADTEEWATDYVSKNTMLRCVSHLNGTVAAQVSFPQQRYSANPSLKGMWDPHNPTNTDRPGHS